MMMTIHSHNNHHYYCVNEPIQLIYNIWNVQAKILSRQNSKSDSSSSSSSSSTATDLHIVNINLDLKLSGSSIPSVWKLQKFEIIIEDRIHIKSNSLKMAVPNSIIVYVPGFKVTEKVIYKKQAS